MRTLNFKNILVIVGIALSIGVFAQKHRERKQLEKINLKNC